MSTKIALLVGCGTAIWIAALTIGLIVGLLIHVTKDVEGVTVSIDSPLDVKVGETFTMKVNVTNEREKKVLSVSDIDFSNEYISGFVVISTDPTHKSSMLVGFDNSISYTFDTTISAGSSKDFTFVLRAEQPGIFRGDVDVYEGARFITKTAQTVVSE